MIFEGNINRVNISEEDISFLEKSQNLPSLEIDKIRDVVRVFVNGELEGSILPFYI